LFCHVVLQSGGPILYFLSEMKTIAPISAVIATRNRAVSLSRTLDSLLEQDFLPVEFIVVDASVDDATKKVISDLGNRVASSAVVRWVKADISGAASQRNQGVSHATQPFIWFFDDDIIFQPGCVERLWKAIQSDGQLGGVSAMIINQRYESPGFVSRTVFTLMHGRWERSFAGKLIGPAVNLLPEDRNGLPEIVAVEWLNLGCTLYRLEALPTPPFPSRFTGYSLMEDVALSLRVMQAGWKLANARIARIFHDSQPGDHKANVSALSAMELVNRHYVMTSILLRRGLRDYLRLILFEIFQMVIVAVQNPLGLVPTLRGKVTAIYEITRAWGRHIK
jgi:glycosyltransferase involved in cell wall biosynthesis